MKKSLMITGIVVLIVILILGAFLILNKKDNPPNQAYDGSLASDEQKDYVGEPITLMHKDFRAVIKKDWQELEIPPSTYVYLPPNTAQDDASAEVISIVVNFLGENNQYTLENLLEQGIENSKIIMPDFEITENIENEKPELSGRKIKFTGTQEGIKRNNVHVFGIKYNNLYSITYSCPVDNCNYYAIYNSLVESFEPVEAK